MRWLKKQYHRYMIRPIVTKTITRTLIGLVIVLLWDKYVNVERIGVSRLGFGLGAVGIILMAGAWFSYLHLDGLTPIDTAKKKFGVKNKKKKETRSKTISRVMSLDNHLSRRTVTGTFKQPT